MTTEISPADEDRLRVNAALPASNVVALRSPQDLAEAENSDFSRIFWGIFWASTVADVLFKEIKRQGLYGSKKKVYDLIFSERISLCWSKTRFAQFKTLFFLKNILHLWIKKDLDVPSISWTISRCLSELAKPGSYWWSITMLPGVGLVRSCYATCIRWIMSAAADPPVRLIVSWDLPSGYD